jgi:tetratricopeptide (TPR) repeat protein
MGRFLQWYLLAWLTGSPLGALVLLLVFWFLADRVTFRFLPDPFRALRRLRRIASLRQALAANPHDRRARFELASLLLEVRRPRDAVEALRPNVEAGDDDVFTAFTMGAALARSGFTEQAERALAAARALDPQFRAGEIDLELGRMRLARRDPAGAREALERLVSLRPGTVEGRWLLGRALDGLGDAAAARRVRDEAWREYAALPRFHRRHERPFAWRIRPWRPAAVAVAIAIAGALAASAVLPWLGDRRAPTSGFGAEAPDE